MKTKENANTTNSTNTESTSKKSSFWKTWGKSIIGLSLAIVMIVAVLVAPTFGGSSKTSTSNAIADKYGIATDSDENSGTMLHGIMDAAGLTDYINNFMSQNMDILNGFTNKTNSDYNDFVESATGVKLPADCLEAQDTNKYLAEIGDTYFDLNSARRSLQRERDELKNELDVLAMNDAEGYKAAVARIDELNKLIDAVVAKIDALGYQP